MRDEESRSRLRAAIQADASAIAALHAATFDPPWDRASVLDLITAATALAFLIEAGGEEGDAARARAPEGFAEAAVLLSEYRKMQPGAFEEWFFYTHPAGWTRIHMSMTWQANEIAAGRAPPSPGGPPEGWRPDFVVIQERSRAAE